VSSHIWLALSVTLQLLLQHPPSHKFGIRSELIAPPKSFALMSVCVCVCLCLVSVFIRGTNEEPATVSSLISQLLSSLLLQPEEGRADRVNGDDGGGI